MARYLFEGATTFGDAYGTADEHYMRFARAGAPGFHLPEESIEKEAPEELAHILTWYGDLRGQALRGFSGEPLQFGEIEAYMRKLARAGIEMDPFDEDLILRVDRVHREVQAGESATPPAEDESRPVET